MRKPGRSEAVKKKWETLIREQAQSRQSVKAFCQVQQVHPSSFFLWKKRLAPAEPCDAAGFVEVQMARSPSRLGDGKGIQTDGWVPGKGAVEVRLKNGRSLWVEPGFDTQHVRALLAVVEAVEPEAC